MLKYAKIPLVGGGAREPALAAALRSDSAVTERHAAPGNPGIGELATLHAVNQSDPEAIGALAVNLKADLVVIGPEAPLVDGVSDAVQNSGINDFWTTQAATALESS